MRLRDHRLTTTCSFTVTGCADRLTRPPRVSLCGLSTRFTSLIQALTGVIGGSGDRDHILDQGGVHRHALLSSRLSLKARETGVIMAWHVLRSASRSRSAASTETRLFTRSSLSRTDWDDVLYPRCVLHPATRAPRPPPGVGPLCGQGLVPTAFHSCSLSPSIRNA
jgi:hypothetical protein